MRSARAHGLDGKFQRSGEVPLRRARERPGYDESQEPNQVARRARRQAVRETNPKPPAKRDAIGRQEKGTAPISDQVGRPKGAKDKMPRGSVKAVLHRLIQDGNGDQKMYDAINAGLQAKPDTAIKFLDLGARVLDKTDDTAGRIVHFHLHTNVDIYALGKAREQHGLPPIARRVDPESSG